MTKPDTSPVERIEAFCSEAERRMNAGGRGDAIYGFDMSVWLYASDLRALLTELREAREEVVHLHNKLSEKQSTAFSTGFEVCREMAATLSEVQHPDLDGKIITVTETELSEAIRALQPQKDSSDE